MWPRMILSFFRLLISEDTVNCFLNLCNGCFTAPIYKGSHVKLLSPGVPTTVS